MYRFLFTEFGCSDQCKNKNGFTPLTLAVYLGKKEMFNFILSLKKVPQWTYGRASSALYPLKEIDTVEKPFLCIYLYVCNFVSF